MNKLSDENNPYDSPDYSTGGFSGGYTKNSKPITKSLTSRFVDDESGMKHTEGGSYDHPPYHPKPIGIYPDSLGPEQDDEFINDAAKAKTSTERVRKYYKRHPEKVRKYLKDTVKDRVARNRDRRKAVKKYGKSKMKNHDVHHPNGAKNGNWRLAKKDHGRDKVNEIFELVVENINLHNIYQFVEYASNRLNIQRPPKVVVMEPSENMTSLGSYDVVSNSISVIVRGRLLADILRTIAHEMVHQRQNEIGTIVNPAVDGATGSPVENQANVIAGILLRDYGKLDKNIFLSENFLLNNRFGMKEMLEHKFLVGKTLLLEAAPKSHVDHPYDDVNLKFSELKDIIHQALLGDFGNQATEKYDGQTLLFTVKDGQVLFARNTQHTKNYGEGAMTADQYGEYFKDLPPQVMEIFSQAAKDVAAIIQKIPPDDLKQIFGSGDKFVLSELLSTDMPNTIPYATNKIVMLNLRTYDPQNGNPTDDSIDRFATDKLMKLIKQHSSTKGEVFSVSGNTRLEFDNSDQDAYRKKEDEYIGKLNVLAREAKLDSGSTLGDYYAFKWNQLLDDTNLDWTTQERKSLIDRWVYGNKEFGSRSIQDANKREAFRKIEGQYKQHLEEIVAPIKNIVLRTANDAVQRATNIVSKNDGTLQKLKKKFLDAVKAIKSSGNQQYIEKLRTELEKLKTIGDIDSITPSEGIIFQRNGKIYKLTGSFTPVNQIVGIHTYKLKDNTPSTKPTVRPTAQLISPTTISGTKGKNKTTASPKQKRQIGNLMQQHILNPETGNQILVKTALGYDVSSKVHQLALQFIKSKMKSPSSLNEGGKAVSSNTKIPNKLAQSTAQHGIELVGFDGLDHAMVGSTHKKLMNDIDLAFDINQVKRLIGYDGDNTSELFVKLKKYLENKNLQVSYVPGFQQFSVSVPLVNDKGDVQTTYDDQGQSGTDLATTQIDFMMGNLPFMSRYMTLKNPQNTEYGSTYRGTLIAEIFSQLIFDTEDPEVKMKYQVNLRNGLERIFFKTKPNGKRDVIKKEFISADPDDIAQVIFGNNIKFDDIDSVERLIEKIRKPESPIAHLQNTILLRFKEGLVDKKMKVPDELNEPTEVEPDEPEQPRRTIAIYPGRFQPYHAGHHVAYEALVKEFGADNVYVVSSNVQDSVKSPFSFGDKKEIMTGMFGIPEDHIIQVKNPYSPKELLDKIPEDAITVFAVGEKDATRLGGKYFHKYDKNKSMMGHKDAGYVWIAPPPRLEINGKEVSGTQLRAAMGDPKATDRAKQEIFTKVYGKFDKKIFDKIVKTSTESEEAKKITAQHATDQPEKSLSKKKTPDGAAIGRAKSVLGQKVRNPKTKRDILVATALKYPKDEPVRIAAEKMVQQAMQKKESILTETSKQNTKLKVYTKIRDYTEEDLDYETDEYFKNERTFEAFPNLADSADELKDMIKTAPSEVLTADELKLLMNSDVGEILSGKNKKQILKKMIQNKKDVMGLLNDIKKEKPIASPIVIKHTQGYYLLGGNTRLSVLASIGHTMPVKVLGHAKAYPAPFIPGATKDQKKVGSKKRGNKELFNKIMQMTITNPETGNQIKVDTAMDYDKNHSAHKLAMGVIRQHMKGISNRAGIPKNRQD